MAQTDALGSRSLPPQPKGEHERGLNGGSPAKPRMSTAVPEEALPAPDMGGAAVPWLMACSLSPHTLLSSPLRCEAGGASDREPSLHATTHV